MDIDLSIRKKISGLSLSNFSILKLDSFNQSFYLKKKRLPSLSKPVIKKKPEPKKTDKNSIFLTQIHLKPKTAPFMKIFNICQKSEDERKRSEIAMVASWLNEISFLYPLPPRKTSLLSSCLKSRHFQKGEYLFRENSILCYLFFVLDGEVLLVKNGQRCGNRHQREIIGENSFINEESYLFSGIANSEVHVFYIETFELLKIIEKEPAHINILISKILKSFPLFKEIPFLKIFTFSKKLKPIISKTQSVVYSPGMPSKSFYVLVYGQVLEKQQSLEKYEESKVIEAESIFGTRDYIMKIPRRTTAQAQANSLIYEVPDGYSKVFLRKMKLESRHQDNFFDINLTLDSPELLTTSPQQTQFTLFNQTN